MNIYTSEGNVVTCQHIKSVFEIKGKRMGKTAKEQIDVILDSHTPDTKGIRYFRSIKERNAFFDSQGNYLPTNLEVVNSENEDKFKKLTNKLLQYPEWFVGEELKQMIQSSFKDVIAKEFDLVPPTDVVMEEKPVAKAPRNEVKQQPKIEKPKIELSQQEQLKAKFNAIVGNSDDWNEVEDIKKFNTEEHQKELAEKVAKKQAENAKKEEEKTKKRDEELAKELPIPEMSVEANRIEIEICNDKERLHQIIDVCNGVLAKISHNKKIRDTQYADTKDLKLMECDIFSIKDMANKRIAYLDNPQEEEQEIEFQWSAAERATNEMWLKEINRYDEMMCQNAREAHEKDLKRYNDALEQGTTRKSEFMAKKAFEEQYLAKLKEHEQNLINNRVEYNEDYENRKFGFAEFEKKKNELTACLDAVIALTVDATKVEKVKNSLALTLRSVQYHERELKDSITPDGIVYNKYCLSMLHRIMDILKGKYDAYNNGEEFKEILPEGKLKMATHALEDNIFKLTHGNTLTKIALQDTKEKLWKKINEKDEMLDRWFVAQACIYYRLVDAHLQATFE